MASESNAVRLVFVGSPLVDITAKCDAETLTQYGLRPDGCIRASENHNDLLCKLFKDPDSYLSAGGSALNSARIAKWILDNKGYVSFIGCVGNDTYKDWLNNILQLENITSLNVAIPGESTGTCICLLTEQGGRSMITSQAAAAKISSQHLHLEHIKSKLSEASHVFAVGYLFSHSPDVVHELANVCSESQIFAFSLSAEYICRQYKEEILQIMPRIDFLFGNESEIVTFGEALIGQQSISGKFLEM
nr:adenosine kinase [Parasteatoda tepidariorum]